MSISASRNPLTRTPLAHQQTETFRKLADIARQEAGLSIEPQKFAMLQTRLTTRLRRLGLSSFEDYLALVSDATDATERGEFISVLTTNVSSFFREPHHFSALAKDIGPALVAKQERGDRVRIWSAGCSNGQEPLSIAMTLIDHGVVRPNGDVKILATDIDPNVIRFAASGTYPDRMISGLPPQNRDRFFDQVTGEDGVSWRASKSVRDLISYRELNLLSPWPMTGKFDVIFCRNVVIYFDQDTQDQLWERFTKILTDDGHLILGHSERLSEPAVLAFHTSGTTTYRHVASATPE
ncbi:protein-glutamate O-methyltransferase CheR [uncultured Aliiroseovarius sp.]|uniref:CheR family methyltransferase n=1 Tax=uncultured Aliiroseovarius sp. TaxID=1658783 RepID=UPI00261EB886|nr:protein-glutamate O-methyltransferase CheR [uncultured Aliiroseovarius sp.]